jgi:hypothetical protein
MSKSPVMRAKIDQFVNHIKKKETRKQIAPIASAVGLALMVAAVVLFILSIVGWFVPGIDGGNLFNAIKLAGLGIFAALVGRQWSALKLDDIGRKEEQDSIKLLEGPVDEVLDLEQDQTALDLKDQEVLEAEMPEGEDAK